MSHRVASRESFEPPAWALSWDADRAADRKGRQMALAFALLLHGALLLVRVVEEPVIPAPVDAVIRPRLRSFVPERPQPPPPPDLVREQPAPSARRVAVPPELAPPEPLPPREIPVAPIELPTSPVSLFDLPAPPPPTPEVVRFRAEMERPVRVGGRDPAYTETARRAREQGVVILDAVIDETGTVTDVEVLRSLRFGLTEAAVRAVSTWRFEPARLDGRPIAVRYHLTVRFNLR